jgi:hypothetical protein
VIRKSEIIVCAEIEDLTLSDLDIWTLRTQQVALGFVETLCTDVSEVGVESLFE